MRVVGIYRTQDRRDVRDFACANFQARLYVYVCVSNKALGQSLNHADSTSRLERVQIQ